MKLPGLYSSLSSYKIFNNGGGQKRAITSRNASGTSKIYFFNIGNVHVLALDLIPVLHADVIPAPHF